jgi:hypothetical protein
MQCEDGESTGRVLGTVDSYAALHQILRDRATELELSRETVDARAGCNPVMPANC